MRSCLRAVFGLRRAGVGCRFLWLAGLPWIGVAPSGLAAYLVDFEGDHETKTIYAAGNVTLSGKEWRLTQALIGTLANDKKHGQRALRMRRDGATLGSAEMLEDQAGGIGEISFWYARYGNETGQPALEVAYSTDGGMTWQAAEPKVTNFPASLTYWSAEINVAGNARIRLRTDGSGVSQRRINIDDIRLTHFDDGTPRVTTAAITEIHPTTAWGGGEVTDDRGSAVTNRGVAWGIAPDPATHEDFMTAGSGTGVFAVVMTGLTPGQNYYVHAFAENQHGTGIGRVEEFAAAWFTNAPWMHAITNRHGGGFTATWQPVDGAVGYLLDIASDTRFHPGGEGTLFLETIGSTPGIRAIGVHDAQDGFDFSGVYHYGDGDAAAAAEVRGTSFSGDYTFSAGYPASGGANIWFTGTDGERGFCIGGIAVRPYTDLRLSFGYRKQSASQNADFTVAWSANGSGVWHPLDVSGLPSEDAKTGWYPIENIVLPAAAAAANTLRLRWVKRGDVAMRIDDILLRGDGGKPTLHPRYSEVPVNATSLRVNRLPSRLWWVRVRAIGGGECVSPASEPRAVETTLGGSVIFFK